jgi:predicted MFS family arabinose efflux permease
MRHNRWQILAVLFLARTAMGFQFQSIASVSPFLIDEFAIDYAMLGTLIGLYNLPGVVFALPGGMLGKRFGEKQVVLAGLVMMALGGVLVGIADDYATAIAGRTLSGCGGVLLNILLAKMTMDWFAKRELVLAMAILVNSWPLGIALALVIQSAAAVALGWPAVLYGTAALSLLSFALIAVGYRPPPGLASPARTGSAAGPGRLFGLDRAQFGGVSLAAAAWTLYNVGLILIVSFGPTFLTARGLALEEAAWMVSLGTWLGIGTVPLGGYLAQRWGRPNLVMMVSLTAAVGICAVLPWAESPLLPFIAFGVFAWAPAGPIMALVSETLSADHRAQGMGLFYTWYYAGMGALPPLAGWARDLSGSADAPIYFASAMMLSALACVGLFRLKRIQLSEPV